MDTQRHAARLAVYKWRTREECIRHSVRQLHYYSDSSPHNGDTLPSFLRFCHGFTVATHDKEPIRGNSTLRERFFFFAFINATFHDTMEINGYWNLNFDQRVDLFAMFVISFIWLSIFSIHVFQILERFNNLYLRCSIYKNFFFLFKYIIYIAVL